MVTEQDLMTLAKGVHTLRSHFPEDDEIVVRVIDCSVRMAQAVAACRPETSHRTMAEFVKVCSTGA